MASELDDFVRRAEVAEVEVEKLLREMDRLEPQLKKADKEEEVPEELVKLRTENAKLKYRLGILERATEEELNKGGVRNRAICPNESLELEDSFFIVHEENCD